MWSCCNSDGETEWTCKVVSFALSLKTILIRCSTSQSQRATITLSRRGSACMITSRLLAGCSRCFVMWSPSRSSFVVKSKMLQRLSWVSNYFSERQKGSLSLRTTTENHYARRLAAVISASMRQVETHHARSRLRERDAILWLYFLLIKSNCSTVVKVGNTQLCCAFDCDLALYRHLRHKCQIFCLLGCDHDFSLNILAYGDGSLELDLLW